MRSSQRGEAGSAGGSVAFDEVVPKPLRYVDATHVEVGGRRLVFFAGCDYFRLGGRPSVRKAMREALQPASHHVAASRLTTGNHVVYRKLERALSRFFRAEAVVVTSTGYITNLVVAQAMQGAVTHAFLDERAHGSLADAAPALGCPVVRFGHRSAEDLRRRLRQLRPGAVPVVLTDGVCAHDGGVAPLADYVSFMGRRGWVLVDDSHGWGVLGRNGRGAMEWVGLSLERCLVTGSLSKGFGGYGGAVVCSQAWAGEIATRSRALSGNTPMPWVVAQGDLAAVELLRRANRSRRHLEALVMHAKGILGAVGLELPDTPAPILALPPGRSEWAARLRRDLLRAGIYPSVIRYPGAPAGGYFRFVLCSEHTRAQVDRLLGVLVPHVGTARKAAP